MPVTLIPESPTVEISAVVQTGKGTSTEADEEKKIGLKTGSSSHLFSLSVRDVENFARMPRCLQPSQFYR